MLDASCNAVEHFKIVWDLSIKEVNANAIYALCGCAVTGLLLWLLLMVCQLCTCVWLWLLGLLLLLWPWCVPWGVLWLNPCLWLVCLG